MDENGLSLVQVRHVNERLPRGQCAHRHRRGFSKGKRLRFRSDFPFLDGDVFGPAAAECRITVDGVASFKACHVRASFFHDPGDLVARNQR